MNGTLAQSKNWTRGGGHPLLPHVPTRTARRVLHRVASLVVLPLRATQDRPPRSCPACHQPIVEASFRDVECRDPSLCWASLSESVTAATARADLE